MPGPSASPHEAGEIKEPDAAGSCMEMHKAMVGKELDATGTNMEHDVSGSSAS